jgi:hypothetical protein
MMPAFLYAFIRLPACLPGGCLQYIEANEPITESQQPEVRASTEQQSDPAAERQPQQAAAAAAAAATLKAETAAAAAAAMAAGAEASSRVRASSSSFTMGIRPGGLADSSMWRPRGIYRVGNQCYGISVLQVRLLPEARQHYSLYTQLHQASMLVQLVLWVALQRLRCKLQCTNTHRIVHAHNGVCIYTTVL